MFCLNQFPTKPETQRLPVSLPGGTLFVWAAWAGMLLLALFYVVKFGSRLPFFDDWGLVPVMTGAEPLTLDYLWAPLNEHHSPLPKLALHILGKLSGYDFRAGMFFSVFLMAGLSLAMLCTARRVRGHLHFADAFFPLLILSLGQWETFLLGSDVNHIGSTILGGAFLILLARSGPRISPRCATGMACCLVPLPLIGANGVALVPPLALWLVYLGIRHCRATDALTRRHGYLLLGLVTCALVLSGLYFLDFPRGAPTPKPAVVLRSGLRVLNLLFGIPGFPFDPLRACLTPLLLLAGGGVWLAAWRRRPEERMVLLGYLAFLLAMGCLIGAVAWGLRQLPRADRRRPAVCIFARASGLLAVFSLGTLWR